MPSLFYMESSVRPRKKRSTLQDCRVDVAKELMTSFQGEKGARFHSQARATDLFKSSESNEGLGSAPSSSNEWKQSKDIEVAILIYVKVAVLLIKSSNSLYDSCIYFYK